MESSSFALTDANAAAVARICRELDCIPLALELAAARVNALTVEDIAGRLDGQFRRLVVGDRAALPRQQTMQATIDWSYDLLIDAEQNLWRCLSVFAGGFTLEAAETVYQVPTPDSPLGAVNLLARLVDKSLVARGGYEGVARYRLLEPLRLYAAEKLELSGEADIIRDRHADWCLKLATQSTIQYFGPHQVE